VTPPSAIAFTFAGDWWDEGISAVLDRLAGRAGLTGCTVTTSYHAARDLLPHNPIRRVSFLESGVIYFQPEEGRYRETSLRPRVATAAAGRDILQDLIAPARQRDFAVGAWTVFLHNTRLATEHPELATRNAFGDRMLSTLCPAQPAVRAFSLALSGDVARHNPAAIHLESLSFMPYDHGGHHERTFIPLDAVSRYLLGVCFCDACLAHARDYGVDVVRVQAFATGHLERAFAGDIAPGAAATIDRAALEGEAGGHMGRFIESRLSTVTTLVREVAAYVLRESPQTRVVFLDVSGAFAAGMPDAVRAVDLAWRDGVDLEAIGPLVSSVAICGYFTDLGRLRREIGAYRALLPAIELEVILRPAWPDALSADQLAARLAAVADERTRFAFYNYGMTRLDALDWIKQALSQPAIRNA
jgi:hypothetical protein